MIDWENTTGFGKESMVAIFTHNSNIQSQSLAYSTDCGRTWTKFAGNPVLLQPQNLEDFRDPKVFWYGENGTGLWVMALAAHNSIRFYTFSKSDSLDGERNLWRGVWLACWCMGDPRPVPFAGGRTDRLPLGVDSRLRERWSRGRVGNAIFRWRI